MAALGGKRERERGKAEGVAALEQSESVAERETTLSLRSNAATQSENRRETVRTGSRETHLE
jgi:hypothetical protein